MRAGAHVRSDSEASNSAPMGTAQLSAAHNAHANVMVVGAGAAIAQLNVIYFDVTFALRLHLIATLPWLCI